jgi:hypothetical protein
LCCRAAEFNSAVPGDMPLQSPTKFGLVANLKTTKALGLTIPEAFLARADGRSGPTLACTATELSSASDDGRGWHEPMPYSAIIELYREAVGRIHRPFIPIFRPDMTRIIYPGP